MGRHAHQTPFLRSSLKRVLNDLASAPLFFRVPTGYRYRRSFAELGRGFREPAWRTSAGCVVRRPLGVQPPVLEPSRPRSAFGSALNAFSNAGIVAWGFFLDCDRKLGRSPGGPWMGSRVAALTWLPLLGGLVLPTKIYPPDRPWASLLQRLHGFSLRRPGSPSTRSKPERKPRGSRP